MKDRASAGLRRGVRPGLVVAGSLALGLAAVLGFGGREPRYQGRGLLDWVQDVEAPGAQQEAQAAIRAIGSKAIPFLLAEVKRDSWREAAAPLRNSLPTGLQEFLPTSDNDLLLNRIPLALSLLGPAALPDLLAAAQDTHPGVQRTAIWSIKLMGPRAERALPVLIQLLGQTNGIQGLAALAVSHLGPARTQAIPALVAALPVTRFEAARALGDMGTDAAAAVPALSTLLGSPQEHVRLQATTALWRITHDSNLVDSVIRELGKRQGYGTYKGFLNLLGEMGPAAKSAIPEILRTMTNWATDVSRPVRPVLQRIDPEAATLLDQPQHRADQAD